MQPSLEAVNTLPSTVASLGSLRWESICADVLGWQPTLQLLLRPLQTLATTFDWRVAEASLYCVR